MEFMLLWRTTGQIANSLTINHLLGIVYYDWGLACKQSNHTLFGQSSQQIETNKRTPKLMCQVPLALIGVNKVPHSF